MKKKYFPILRWLWRILGQGKKWIFLLIFVKILQGIEGAFFALELRNVIDAAVGGQKNAFFIHLFVLGILVISAIFLNTLGQWWAVKSVTLVEQNLRVHVFSELILRCYPQVAAVHSGEWMMRIISDADVVVEVLLSVLPKISGVIVQIASALVILFIMFPPVAYLLIPAGAVIAVLSSLLRRRVHQLYSEVQETDGSMRSFMQEHLTNLAVVHTFTQEENTIKKAGMHADQLVDRIFRRGRFSVICNSITYGMMRGGYLLGIVLCGVQILKGNMTYGTMAAVLQLITKLDLPVSEIFGAVFQCLGMCVSAERLMEAEGYSLDYREKPHTIKKAKDYYQYRFASMGLRHADFSYYDDSERMIIKDLNIEIGKGESIAFVGESGCGKSTVLKLLMSLYHIQNGEAYLRNTDGKEQVLDSVWRALFAYVPQGNHLISGTIRETIAFGDSDLMKQEEKIWKAVEIACADEFINELSDGLDTVLGERGSGLSEGQMQRIAIARAVLSERPILMLDECTSALDAETEKKLLLNLRTMTDRTVLLVTHRSAVLEICDRTIEISKMNG